jgi:hypothetical protein
MSEEKTMLRIILSVCLSYLLMLTYTAPAQAITIDLLPEQQEVDVNTSASVEIMISGLFDGAAPSLGVFDLNIMYDTSMLSFSGLSGVTFGDQLDLSGFGSAQAIDNNSPGLINLFELSFDLPDSLNNLQQPSFTLATLTFETIAAGISKLGLEVNTLGDANGDPLTADTNGAEIKVVQSTLIPEPASLLLLLTGMAGMYWLRDRRADIIDKN